MIGKVYGIPPQPPVEEQTHRVPAGAVTLGVEYRALDPESLRATYASNPAFLAELEARSPEGGFTDEGVSIHVWGSDDGHEYLRFDVFVDEPHYHYVHNTGATGDVVNNVIDFDAVASGDMLRWVLGCLRTRLPEMLRAAGGESVADGVDPAVVAAAVDDVARLADAVRGP
ncbi:MAG TPA: hypothetical protein VK549_09910 [Acidimicrobiia bacterium]|nr:hypothetical protein [Acidimicrobiia bacterium]